MTARINPISETQRVVSANIRKELKQRGIELQHLAAVVGVTKGFLSCVLRGHSAMSLVLMEKIFEALGLGDPVITASRSTE